MRTRDGPDSRGQIEEMVLQWSALFPEGRELPAECIQPSWTDPSVNYVVSGRLNYSAQYPGVSGGQHTVDTFLDQVVFWHARDSI